MFKDSKATQIVKKKKTGAGVGSGRWRQGSTEAEANLA